MALPLACGGVTDPAVPASPGDFDVATPLTDMGGTTYKGFAAGLYPGANTPPSDHAAAGDARLADIVPRAPSGIPSDDGRIALLSVGMSNTTREFCKGPVTGCAPWSFVGQALADPAVDRSDLVLVDENPLEDPTTLSRPRGVAINGRWLDAAALDELRAESESR